MKKNFMTLTILFVAVAVLTGCGNKKTLTCTSDTETIREIKIEYNKDEVKKMTMKQFLGEGKTDEEVSTAKKTYEEQLEKNKTDGLNARRQKIIFKC